MPNTFCTFPHKYGYIFLDAFLQKLHCLQIWRTLDGASGKVAVAMVFLALYIAKMLNWDLRKLIFLDAKTRQCPWLGFGEVILYLMQRKLTPTHFPINHYDRYISNVNIWNSFKTHHLNLLDNFFTHIHLLLGLSAWSHKNNPNRCPWNLICWWYWLPFVIALPQKVNYNKEPGTVSCY